MSSRKKKQASPELIQEAIELSASAKALLDRWQLGKNVSQPFRDFDPFTYSSHAKIYLDNAVRLCADDGMSDFRVFGALYLLRHGLELMLKCWSRNPQIDKVLGAVMTSGLSFDDVCGRLWTDEKERRQKRPLLRRAVCALRNHLQDGLKWPEMYNVNIDDAYAGNSLLYLRKHPETERYKFAMQWPVASSGHKLPALWDEALSVMDEFADAAKGEADSADQLS